MCFSPSAFPIYFDIEQSRFWPSLILFTHLLDTFCLIKQINRDTLENYEYSLKEVDTKFYDLKKFKDPDVRYYACVVDKNRAGAKPTLVFRLNLAYNVWEELGYVRLKQ